MNTSAHSFTFNGLDGGSVQMSDYAGKAVLVVNTASKCGFTPQYQGLQRLWLEWREAGLVVLGVPCNDFAAQEPGDSRQIQSFCTTHFQVSFPMTAKVHVRGRDIHPFYRWTSEQTGFVGRPRWNFYKYLIGRQGELMEWYSSMTAPSSRRLIASIRRAVA